MNQERVIKIKIATPEYSACKKDVDELRRKLSFAIGSAGVLLREYFPDVKDIRDMYRTTFRRSIDLALEEVDVLMSKHKITRDEDVQDLRDIILDLWDEVDDAAELRSKA